METIGTKISKIRKQKGMSQEALSDLSKINLRTLQRIEKDENEPRGNTLKQICEALKTPIEELESLWLANKVYSIVRDEESALSALKVAEEQITYNTLKNGK
jgi:transcriptional regulator with XRE-family HTH domain